MSATSQYPRAIIPSDGRPGGSCLWHRQHQHYMEHVVPMLPHCTICGGVSDPRVPDHALCLARVARSLPTPRLDQIHRCLCAACHKAAPQQEVGR